MVKKYNYKTVKKYDYETVKKIGQLQDGKKQGNYRMVKNRAIIGW